MVRIRVYKRPQSVLLIRIGTHRSLTCEVNTNLGEMMFVSILQTFSVLLILITSFSDAYGFGNGRLTTRVSRGSSSVSLRPSRLLMGLESTVVLKGNGLSKNWIGNDRPQFKDISLSIVKGNRIGLIGPNGTGKSTLLKVLASLEDSDTGQLEVEKNSMIVYVEQEPRWSKDPNVKVYKALFDIIIGNRNANSNIQSLQQQQRAIVAYYTAIERMETDDGSGDMDVMMEELSQATEMMENSNGWEYQNRAVELLDKLGIAPAGNDKENKDILFRGVSTLSGGEAKRLSLAAALAVLPDVLFLDEPTNHLDIEGIEWLSAYIAPASKEKKEDSADKEASSTPASTGGGGGVGAGMTILTVTHDRYFLDRIAREIYELDQGSLTRYQGNYNAYLALKRQYLENLESEYENMKNKARYAPGYLLNTQSLTVLSPY